MPIDPNAVGARGEPTRHSWTSTDAILYALGVGAGAEDPLGELAFTTENSNGIEQQVLPTMAVVLGVGGAGAFGSIGSFNPAMLVHGEQAITLAGPIPVRGEVETVGEITGIYDKGKGALVEVTSRSTDVATGAVLFTNVMSAFIRGEGGFGGDRGPSGPRHVAPEREPDHVTTYATRTDQALLYRLSGDRNPLHSDPTFAALGGFDPSDPPRAVHLRVHRAGAAPPALRRRPRPLRRHRGSVLVAGAPGRAADRADVVRRRGRGVPHARRRRARRARQRSLHLRRLNPPPRRERIRCGPAVSESPANRHRTTEFAGAGP